MPGRIVVGIDGSPESAAALRWALAEGGLRGAVVAAVHAWTFVPPSAMGEPDVIPIAATSLMDDLNLQREAAEAALGEALGDTGETEVERVVTEGAPGDVLVDAARDADLLVVGSRGRGGFKGALLGSVSQHVVQHAPCPIVIVRA